MTRQHRAVPTIAATALCACSVTLTDAQIYSAAEDPCIPDARQTDDVIQDMEATGRRVSVRRHGRGATVLPGRVLLPPDWETRSQPGRVSLLAHEWTHVCQQGDRAAAWVVRYALDVDHRAVTELAGIVAQGRALLELTGSRRACVILVEDRVSGMPDRHLVRWDQAWMRGTLIPMVAAAACGESE